MNRPTTISKSFILRLREREYEKLKDFEWRMENVIKQRYHSISMSIYIRRQRIRLDVKQINSVNFIRTNKTMLIKLTVIEKEEIEKSKENRIWHPLDSRHTYADDYLLLLYFFFLPSQFFFEPPRVIK